MAFSRTRSPTATKLHKIRRTKLILDKGALHAAALFGPLENVTNPHLVCTI